jgi:C1A family cysteine protease
VTHAYGWRPDKPDHRDWHFATALEPEEVPTKVDLRVSGHLPPVYDQGQLGSCTGNGIAAAVDYENHRQGEAWVNPSRLFIYFNERELEGTVSADSGAEIRDGIKVLNQYGVCSETDWPYEIDRFTEKPPAACYSDGLGDRALAYHRAAQDQQLLREALAEGLPVVVGISIYESFESAEVAQSGDAPMPRISEQPLGGHCVLLVGYDDGPQRWLLRNSWGAGWGQDGYFTLPYPYLTTEGLSSDFWVISRTGKS